MNSAMSSFILFADAALAFVLLIGLPVASGLLLFVVLRSLFRREKYGRRGWRRNLFHFASGSAIAAPFALFGFIP